MTTPDKIIELIEAFRRSKTMFAAVELGIFDGARPSDHKALPRLLDACVALELLEKRDGAYVNTPQADKYLRSDSPDTLAGYIRYSNEALYPMWGHLEDAVREAVPRWQQTFGVASIWAGYYRTEEAKRDFLKGMHGFGRISSPAVAGAFDLSRFHRMIDLGGASGHLVAAVRERYPNIQAQVFDLAEVAKLYPGTIAGNFFTDALPQADLYSLGRILHDWSDEKCSQLLPKIFASLPEGGGLLIAEKLLTPDNVSAHMQSMNMLVNAEGRERTAAEYEALLHVAGFSQVESRVTGSYLDALLAIK
ncbi:MAG TPA: class I SAM-dependent methyltransferase [Bryobacteraceae bacterium]|nr:class I SAM-dependent methyltransferase [Bryobacteraceae bacterium]